MREEYEGIARRALQNAVSALTISRGDERIAERYRQQALAYCEITKAASALLAAINVKEVVR
jgi:hypothetical protein|tara:strand:- start:985 stop:1170 length:186 start_codon:yes stop_codon:yes gene_type:complete